MSVGKQNNIFIFFWGIFLSFLLSYQAFSLSEKPADVISGQPEKKARIENNIQTVEITVGPRSYEPILLQKGLTVKWSIKADASNLNGCNNAIVIPEFGIRKKLSPGNTIVEFTPTKEGTFSYSCWMGMIRSTIRVVDSISNP